MHPHREEASRDRSRRVAKHAESSDKVQDKAMIVRAFREHDDQLHDGKKTKLKLRRGGRAKVEGHDGKKRLDRASWGRTKRDMGGPTPGVTGGAMAPMAAPGGAQMTPQQMQQIRAAQAQRGAGMAPAGATPNGMQPMAKRGGRMKRAEGGRTMGKGKGGGGKGNHVNVIVAPGAGGGGAGAGRPVPVPVPVRKPPMAAGAPMPPPGGMPPRPMMPPGGAPGGVPGMGGPPMAPPPGIKRGGRAKAHA